MSLPQTPSFQQIQLNLNGKLSSQTKPSQKNLDLVDYKGGPFIDRSGGLITFSSDDLEQANKIVSGDPFVKWHVISDKHIKVWIAEN